MELKIAYSKFKNREEAYQYVSTRLKEQGLSGLPIQVEFQFKDTEKVIEANGKGLKLVAHFEDQQLLIKIELGLLYRAFQNRVGDLVEKQLKIFL